MDWTGTVLGGVAVLALLRWGYWLVIELNGDTQKVSFGWRVWLSFFLALGIMLALGIPLQRFGEISGGVLFFDGAILYFLEIIAYLAVCCLAGAALYFLGGKSIPFYFCGVSCYLAWRAVAAFAFVSAG